MLTRTKAKQRRTRGKPNYVDIHVGKRIRQRRSLLGMTQENLGSALDLTFQQIQKYERGANRIGAGRLYELCQALDVPVSYFFEEIDEIPDTQATSTMSTTSETATGPMSGRTADDHIFEQREALNLVRTYYSIRDREVRRRMLDLLKSLVVRNDGDSA